MKNAFFLYRFHSGMIIALSLVLVSFEWKTFSIISIDKEKLPITMHPIEEDAFPPITRRKIEPPNPIKKKSLEFVVVEPSEPESPGPDPIFTGPDPDLIEVPEFFEPDFIDDTPSYTAEDKPEYPGGISALYSYLKSEIEYSERCKEARIEGKVYVKFVVDKNGKAVSPEILRGVKGCPELEQKVLNAISNMKQWTPGKQNGRIVSVYMTLPVTFSLR